jgi:type II secretory pathway component PulF
MATRRLLIAAERSGDLEAAFTALAEDMAVEVDQRASRLLAAMEPILIVCLFGIVGSMLLAILFPILTAAGGIE